MEYYRTSSSFTLSSTGEGLAKALPGRDLANVLFKIHGSDAEVDEISLGRSRSDILDICSSKASTDFLLGSLGGFSLAQLRPTTPIDF